ncbi:general secretion pathway protein GspK [Xanthomonas hortorum]|uniref:Type II secretion system protein K n=1 Tax=Xanthomonas hortorum pv. pelargonii TaxID=453602 RepID=A0A6V7EJ14_9XANT|nr:type II secretion system protein GspK [Xanthomonas hortorum]MCE4352617.1 type II secretion system protein GspK [Xanthomonas hortorum pv. pelargonii]MCM5524352.1 type II secretion system protein GspK [Xanthomonas hortorum pv. pelargonii]MCM5536865.1 type II secretion system protein GspK [Xanthomonas hortorum pv. pelargonii]MCM5541083.1 type II secretion system protein GspK [Xanthomonas hortorum pv. pelargonii]MCM5546080.1 type II secretion system protein GspK [Xanthomonas hortorum pv. pelarg
MSAMRGAALVLVLWLIALLTAMIGAFALTARVEALQGSMLRNGAQAQEYARSGLEYALSRMQSTDTQARWRADGRRYRWQMDDATVEIRITDESGKVDLNMAEPALLAGLVRAVGGEQGRDTRIAGAIVDWRDGDSLGQPGGGAEDRDYADAGLPYGAKDGPFETLGELRLVLGMDGELYRKLLPNLTLYSGRSRPEARFAPGPVLTAMGLDARQLLAQRDAPPSLPGSEATLGGSDTYSIESRARLSQGREAVLRAVVSISASALPGSAYTVLRWEEGAAVQ